VFNDSDIIVREDEPSSLIAFALNSQDYEIKLDFIRNSDTSGTERPQSSEEALPSHFFDGKDHPELERSLLKTTGTHLKYRMPPFLLFPGLVPELSTDIIRTPQNFKRVRRRCFARYSMQSSSMLSDKIAAWQTDMSNLCPGVSSGILRAERRSQCF